jgi:hypothetical protein
MDWKDWTARKLDGLRRDEVSAFARGLRKRLRDPALETVRIAKDLRPATWTPLNLNAFTVAWQLRDQAIVPLVELPPPEDPKDRRRRFGWAIDEEVKLRRKVIEQIDRLLSDKTVLPPAPGAPDAPASVMPAPPRVCDAGYVLMRKIVNAGDDLPGPYTGEAAFYALPEAERDALMAQARTTVLWQRLLHGDG